MVIVFSKNSREDVCNRVSVVLVNRADYFGKYLGLLSFIGRNKTANNRME